VLLGVLLGPERLWEGAHTKVGPTVRIEYTWNGLATSLVRNQEGKGSLLRLSSGGEQADGAHSESGTPGMGGPPLGQMLG